MVEGSFLPGELHDSKAAAALPKTARMVEIIRNSAPQSLSRARWSKVTVLPKFLDVVDLWTFISSFWPRSSSWLCVLHRASYRHHLIATAD